MEQKHTGFLDKTDVEVNGKGIWEMVGVVTESASMRIEYFIDHY
jgi:hypothetical protein